MIELVCLFYSSSEIFVLFILLTFVVFRKPFLSIVLFYFFIRFITSFSSSVVSFCIFSNIFGRPVSWDRGTHPFFLSLFTGFPPSFFLSFFSFPSSVFFFSIIFLLFFLFFLFSSFRLFSFFFVFLYLSFH